MTDRIITNERFSGRPGRHRRPPIAPPDPLQGMELSQTASGLTVAEQRLEGIEFLAHLEGAEAFVNQTRDEYIDRYPFPRTLFIVVWGRTGAGKKTLISQLVHKTRNDEKLNGWLEKSDLTLDLEYISFAESANLAKLRGLVDPDKKHGTYNNKEYRNASITNSEFVLRNVNDYNQNPKWVFVEATGPAAYFEPITGDIDGPDRANSTVHILGQKFADQTKVMVVDRDAEIIEKVIITREKIENAKPRELPTVLEESGLQVARNGQPIDLRRLPMRELRKLHHEVIEGQASSMGVWKSNRETDDLREKFGEGDDDGLWVALRTVMGFNPTNFVVFKNHPTSEVLTVHHEALNAIDPIRKEIDFIMAISTPARRKRYLEMIKAA
jgi:hypothetical protein